VKEKEIQADLASIRSMMERSSKFISLSGLSGILAGVYALIGAVAANAIINSDPYYSYGDINARAISFFSMGPLALLCAIALVVLIASVLTAYVLSARKAKTKGQQIWGKTSKAMLYSMAVPLVSGGLLMIVLLDRGYYGIVAPASLIFYGLALVAAANFTFNDVKFLGLCEIVLGLIAACYPGYGLIFWAIGFGVLHIIYGSVMYLKYDR